MDNVSHFTTFTLSGLNESVTNKYIYFALTLLWYLVIIIVNLTLIALILLEKTLHEPMYIFLCNLCVNGLYGTAGFCPKLLADFLSDTHVISYTGCLLQTFVIFSYSLCEFTNLTVMAYDRYVAICKPLHYNSIMTPLTVGKLLLFSWIFPCFSVTFTILLTIGQPFCGNHIEKLYCDNWSLERLLCKFSTVSIVFGLIQMACFIALVLFIFYSYIKLIAACRRSQEDRSKFMHTCLPHLITFLNFIIATLFDTLNTRFGDQEMSQSLRNLMSVEYLIVPPLFNPIIYGFKLNQIRKKVLRMLCNHKIAQI
ncbi:olfactory receptor 13D1-like [Lepisosteus oculatus]|uniref:olfactory receptor 13D1-like n=1 Tax=Lepisosteus oculatus TaxID=7918 RepID=UPI00370FCA0B